MTAVASTLPSAFQLSSLGPGAIVTGVDDVNQCIDFILRTIPGTDPLRPLFGSYVYQHQDRPVTDAIPNIKKEIFSALELWEPRIKVLSLTHELVVSQIIFSIGWVSADGLTKGTTSWYSGGLDQTQTNNIIIYALVPLKVVNGIYRITFQLNGTNVLPNPPATGFTSAAELLAWVNQNWYNYGKWYLTGTTLVLYLTPGLSKKVYLSISQVALITLRALIPDLAAYKYFNLSLTTEGADASPAFPINMISTLEQLILWVQNNWTGYGNFTIESDGKPTVKPGDFNTSFNNDFLKQRFGAADRYLVFQTELYTTVTLSFN